MRKKSYFIIAAMMLSGMLAACGASGENTGADSVTTNSKSTTTVEQLSVNTDNAAAVSSGTASAEQVVSTAAVTSNGWIDATDLFTERDLTQTADLTDAQYITVTDG